MVRATLCEIDRTVVDTARQHYPSIPGTAFEDPRTELVIADGCKYVAETEERFDAIIVDSSEPIGPSAVLHTREFFSDCRRALKRGGVLVTQNGLPFLFPAHLGGTTAVFASLFKRVAPYLCTQPCYFGGPFALNLATDDKHVVKVDAKQLAKRQKKRGVHGLKYWTPHVHIGAFALPAYAQRVVDAAIEQAREEGTEPVAYVASLEGAPAAQEPHSEPDA